jgi:hypothetical protein
MPKTQMFQVHGWSSAVQGDDMVAAPRGLGIGQGISYGLTRGVEMLTEHLYVEFVIVGPAGYCLCHPTHLCRMSREW